MIWIPKRRGLILPPHARRDREAPPSKKCDLLLNPYRFGASFNVDAAKFVSPAIMTRTTIFTGAVDSKTGIFSCWINMVSSTNTSSGGAFIALKGPSNQVYFDVGAVSNSINSAWSFINMNTGNNLSSAIQLAADSAALDKTFNTWHHVIIGWDATPANFSKTFLYFDDVESDFEAAGQVLNQIVNWSTGFTNFAVGGSRVTGPTNVPFPEPFAMAEVYLAPNQWIDVSVSANRQKWRSPAGKPISLGATGSLPTGTAPAMYLHLDDGEAVANFATNRAGNGNLTISGTLQTAATSPSD